MMWGKKTIVQSQKIVRGPQKSKLKTVLNFLESSKIQQSLGVLKKSEQTKEKEGTNEWNEQMNERKNEWIQHGTNKRTKF